MLSVDAERLGLASGINSSVTRLAGVFAIAVLGPLMIAGFRHSLEAAVGDMALPAAVLDHLRLESARLADAQVPAGLDSATAAAVAAAIKWAFVDAFRWTVGIAGALCWLGAGVAAWLLPGRKQGIHPMTQRIEVQTHAVD